MTKLTSQQPQDSGMDHIDEILEARDALAAAMYFVGRAREAVKEELRSSKPGAPPTPRERLVVGILSDAEQAALDAAEDLLMALNCDCQIDEGDVPVPVAAPTTPVDPKSN